MIVKTISNNETILFAADELKKYLSLIDHNISKDFNITLDLLNKTNEEIDTIHVNITNTGGIIFGSNPRSILFGVYQYLEALGVRWVRHGEDGEYLPSNVSVCAQEVHFTRTAKNKYRGICIEGAVSIENMLDNIDWAAKMGFNAYFIQFTNPYDFFNRWYTHRLNPLLETHNLTDNEVIDFKTRMIIEIKKRGLSFHDVGHGWTCAPLGLHEHGRYDNINDEITNALALVNGKREIWNGSPVDTQLCYSNPHVRKKMVDYCVDYIKNHKEVDVIHFWLADGERNHCECDNCQKKRPSDWYVMLLNDIDAALTRQHLETKIVFLAYIDLLWAPETEKINNPNRFIFMLAPIGRNYKTSYADLGTLPEEPTYIRNQMENPVDIESNISHLKRWQALSPVDGFTFEYYYWRGGNEHYGDYGGLNLAKIVYRDIQNLDKTGLSGIVSCQTQRAFMPTGFGSYVMAKTLWDDTIPFDNLLSEYFKDSFGELGDIFKAHFIELSKLAQKPYGTLKAEQIKKTAEEMLAYIERNLQIINTLAPCHAQSVTYAKFHCNLLIKHMEAELVCIEKGFENSIEQWRAFIRFLQENEADVQSVFDLFLFLLDLRTGKHKELKNYDLF